MIEMLEARTLLTPVISNVESVTYPFTVNAPPTPISSTLTLTDATATQLVGATVQLDVNFSSSQDVLGYPTNIGNITGVFDSTTGLMTLTGDDTLANYQAALQSVTYQNTSSNPSTVIRRFKLTANDGTQSNPAYRYLKITSMISNVETLSFTHTAGDTPTPITNQVILAPTASGSLTSVSIRVDANYVNGQDVLGFVNSAKITGAWDAASATITLTSVSGQTPSVADFQAALRSVTYKNTNPGATASSRRFAIWTNNGDTPVLNAYRYYNIVPGQQRPVISNLESASYSYTATNPPAVISSQIIVTDGNSATLASATISINANYIAAQDVLGFVPNAATMGNIAIVSNAGGTLTLASAGATATVANWQAALRAVTYSNSSTSPTTGIRRFLFQVNDGGLYSLPQYRYFTVAAPRQRPAVSNLETVSYAYTATSPAAPISKQLVVTAPSSPTLTKATISIDANYVAAQDVLGFVANAATMGNIAVSSNTAGVLTLTSAGGTATLANWQAALRAVTFANNSSTPTTGIRRFMFQVTDGTLFSLPQYRYFTVAPPRVRPTVSGLETVKFIYNENDAATPITNQVVVAAPGSNTIASGTVSIDGNFTPGEDVLNFMPDPATMGNIAIVSNSGGVLRLASAGATATAANWQAAFRAVTYLNTSEAPSNAIRRFLFQVNDGTMFSLQQYRWFGINPVDDAPTVSAPATATIVEDTSVAITAISIADVDAGSANISVTLSVTHGALTLNTGVAGGLIASQIAGNGTAVVTITAPMAVINATLADAAGLSYLSTTNYNGTDTLSIDVSDLGNTGAGGPLAASAVVGLTVSAINDAPTVAAPASVVTPMNTQVVIPGISVADVDVGSSNVTVTFSVSHGVLTLKTRASQIMGSSISINSSVTSINSLLADPAGLKYLANDDYTGDDVLTITITDGGNTGAGGPQTTTVTVAITITVPA